jgi:N-acetylmuramoyl-L-alanine amidase
MHRARTPPFRSIGYHWVIRRDGMVEPGRWETSARTPARSVFAGRADWSGRAGSRVDTMTPAQEVSLIRLIRDLLERYPQAKVVGHRDLAPTQCPGFDVIPWWAEVEQSAPVRRNIIPSVAVWFASFRRAFTPAAWR